MSSEFGSTGVAISPEQIEVPFTPKRRVNVCRSGCDYSTLSEAVAHAEDYDLILVQADTYIDCAVVPQNVLHIWIRGVGGLAHMKSIVCENKGSLVITGIQAVIENFEFSDLDISCELGQNAVGVRLQSGDLVVINSYFHDSQGGILTANTRISNIMILNSRFERLGKNVVRCASNPFTWSHSIYIGEEGSFALINSIVKDNSTGHLIKSRARETILECNRILNGYDLKYKKNGFLVDLPQGGEARIRNNLLAQGPNSSQDIILSYGEEIRSEKSASETYPLKRLQISENTLRNDLGRGTFIQVSSATSPVSRVSANIFIGAGARVGGRKGVVPENESGSIQFGPKRCQGLAF